MAQRPSKQLRVSELDFEQIKGNLKQFLQSQDTLRDYNFEGSALGTLIDVLAYVTHYNAINANIGINETFLETAQSRGSVVGHARQLAYTPKSAVGAVASINIEVNDPNSNVLTIDKNHRFTSTVDGTTYTFVTTKSHNTQNATFIDVEVRQGVPRSTEYIFDVNASERFIIPDIGIDTSTLQVDVYENESQTTFTTFTPAKNINQITRTTPVYFLNETFNGRYEITFGDGVIGKALADGNLIKISYLATDGPDANGAVAFSMIDSIQGNTGVTITTNAIAEGGDIRESIKSIKYNAPLTFAAQNRAVTPDDYKAIILENFNNAKSIVVWGGEDSDPPQYGKAFISIIPLFGETISSLDKDFIVENIIRPKTVVSITPEFVDPTYTYVSLEVFYKRNSSESTLSFGQIDNLIRQSIADYSDDQLKRFDGVLRYSSLLSTIDTSEKSIINSTVRVYLKKRFIPILNENRRYDLEFSSPIYSTESNKPVIYRSTVFTYSGEQCTLQDYVDNNGERKIRVIRGSGVNQITVANDVGYIDALAGKIVLTNFNPSAFIGPYIEITVIPNSNDVAPKRNNVVSIDMNDVIISGTGDPIITGSSAGGLNYDLVPRHG